MPNHVHVLVDVKRTPLGRIVQSWNAIYGNEDGAPVSDPAR